MSPIEIAWTVVGSAVTLLMGAGYAFVGYSHPEFGRARFCLYLSAIILGGMEIVWYAQTGWPFLWRIAIASLICLTIGIGLPETLRWVHRRESLALPPPTPPAGKQEEPKTESPKVETRSVAKRQSPAKPTEKNEPPRNPQSATPPSIETDVHETLASGKLAQGWTLHKRPESWGIYLIVDADQLSRPMIDAMDQTEISPDKELTEKVKALWIDIRSKVPGPKALQTEYGEIRDQEFIEHLVHYRVRNQNTVTWNYEVFQIRDGTRTGITPQSAKMTDISISDLSTKSQGTITELDAMAVHQVNRRYVDAMVKISK